MSHRRDQAFTRRDQIFATVPDDLRPVLRALRRMAVDEAVKTGVLPPRSVDRRVQLEPGAPFLFNRLGNLRQVRLQVGNHGPDFVVRQRILECGHAGAE